MATPIEKLVDELERSYRETQERQSDPAVYNDHREAAAVGRRLKELEGPYRLAQAWRPARADLDAAPGGAGGPPRGPPHHGAGGRPPGRAQHLPRSRRAPPPEGGGG